jgi:hypothetical protein
MKATAPVHAGRIWFWILLAIALGFPGGLLQVTAQGAAPSPPPPLVMPEPPPTNAPT